MKKSKSLFEFKSSKSKKFSGVSIIVTTDPRFVEAKFGTNATSVDILNTYGTVTELVKELLLKIGIAEDVVHSAMDYAHNQAMSGVSNNAEMMAGKILQ